MQPLEAALHQPVLQGVKGDHAQAAARLEAVRQIAEGLIDGNGVTEKPTLMTNEQIREGGYMEDIVKAMEHDTTGIPGVDAVGAYKAIEHGVVGTYEKIEDAVVSGYKKVEQGAVSGFTKITDKFVEKFFAKEGETVEEARERLSRK